MANKSISAIYDFTLLPYALGDVLTWNVQTAIHCEGLGRERVDVHICMDERSPINIYQRELITSENCGLFFNELFGAFGTHPKLGGLYFYRQREEMLERLGDEARGDDANAQILAEYQQAFSGRKSKFRYFISQLHSHERINAFAQKHGRIPLLRPSLGCEPDVAGLVGKLFAGKKIVTIHVRLRRLDAGYGGVHTYRRDSDFLEWYEFLRETGKKHPDVQLVVMGRLQEKPLELLKLPNVTSLRTMGLGLGHELTLMLQSDLFIGTSSGFAAMANFSEVPYFITKMTRASCIAYHIEQGCDRLPFATERQTLVYEPETRELLMNLLERGLEGVTVRSDDPVPAQDGEIEVHNWVRERSRWLHPGATSSRFFDDDDYSDRETAYLVWPKVEQARIAWSEGLKVQAWSIVNRIEANFPRMCERYPEFLWLKAVLAFEREDQNALNDCVAKLTELDVAGKDSDRILEVLRLRLQSGTQPATMSSIESKNKQHILRELADLLARLITPRKTWSELLVELRSRLVAAVSRKRS